MPADGADAELARYGRRAVADGLVVGASGNLSVRHGDRVTVTPRAVALERLDDVVCPVVSIGGRLLAGDLEPSSETPMHLAVYAAHPDAGAIVHTHSPVATALSTVVDEVPPVHYNAVDLGGALRVAPYATFGTDELADNVVAALEGRTAAILANHGTIAYGTDLAQAYRRSRLVEWLCEVYHRALQVGRPRVLTEEQLDAVRRRGPMRRYQSGGRT